MYQFIYLLGEKYNLYKKPSYLYFVQLSKFISWNYSKNNRMIKDLTALNHGLVYTEKL